MSRRLRRIHLIPIACLLPLVACSDAAPMSTLVANASAGGSNPIVSRPAVPVT